MAGGIDWFRWHHGSVTDPKFQLVARKAGVRLPDVLAVWAFLLEKASASDERGSFGEIDCEAVDCLFGLDDGQTAQIIQHMGVRGLVADERVTAWEKRQPKRERDADDSTERTRLYRERQAKQRDATENHVTPCDATVTQKTPRGEESREEKSNTPSSLRSEGVPAKRRKSKTPMPDDFGISDRVSDWAAQNGYGQLAQHLDAFRRKATAKGYTYASWDDAFMEAIREDWAKLRGRSQNGAAPPPDQQQPKGRDPALLKIEQDASRAAPMPAAVREKLAELTNQFKVH